MSAINFGRNVFVLDISGSMSGMKCQTLQLSANRIIEDIPENSYVGVVLFDNRTELAHSLTQITSRSVRDKLIQSVPSLARGCTDIAQGVLRGVQALKDAGVSTEGATLFLATDGQDGSGYVDKVLPTLLSAKIKVICIAIGVSADPNLERLSNATNGKTYSASDTNKELALQAIEATIQEVQQPIGNELAEAVPIWVCYDILQLDAKSVTKNVVIDPDISKNIVFTIGSDNITNISVDIQSPNGRKYDKNSPEMTTNSNVKRIEFRPVGAEPGLWVISITKNSDQIIRANFTAKSQVLSETAIELNVTVNEATSTQPPIIVAELHKGNNVVIGADVSAIIDNPDSTQSTVKLNEYNNIYCNYLSGYCGDGRYNVTVLAQNLGQTSRFKVANSSHANSPAPKFQRALTFGSIKITGPIPVQTDIDSQLKELSLAPQYNKKSSADPIIVEPVIEVVRPVIKIVKKVDEKKATTENIFTLLLVIKKSINSTKITDYEREDIKKSINEIDRQMSDSDITLTIEELNGFVKVLEDFKLKFK